LPANPLLSLSGGRRAATKSGPTTFDWYVTLSQDIEVGGQRRARRKTVQEEVKAQEKRSLATARDVATEAWTLYFEALFGEEERRLATRLEGTARRMAEVARERAKSGVASTLDADLTEASSLRLVQARMGAERQSKAGNAALMTLLGLDPTRGLVSIEGD